MTAEAHDPSRVHAVVLVCRDLPNMALDIRLPAQEAGKSEGSDASNHLVERPRKQIHPEVSLIQTPPYLNYGFRDS